MHAWRAETDLASFSALCAKSGKLVLMVLFLGGPPNQLREPPAPPVRSVLPDMTLPAPPHNDDEAAVDAISASRTALKYEPVCFFLRHNAKNIATATANAAEMIITPKEMATFQSPSFLPRLALTS